LTVIDAAYRPTIFGTGKAALDRRKRIACGSLESYGFKTLASDSRKIDIQH